MSQRKQGKEGDMEFALLQSEVKLEGRSRFRRAPWRTKLGRVIAVLLVIFAIMGLVDSATTHYYVLFDEDEAAYDEIEYEYSLLHLLNQPPTKTSYDGKRYEVDADGNFLPASDEAMLEGKDVPGDGWALTVRSLGFPSLDVEATFERYEGQDGGKPTVSKRLVRLGENTCWVDEETGLVVMLLSKERHWDWEHSEYGDSYEDGDIDSDEDDVDDFRAHLEEFTSGMERGEVRL